MSTDNELSRRSRRAEGGVPRRRGHQGHPRYLAHRDRRVRWGLWVAALSAVVVGVVVWIGIRGFLAVQELSDFRDLATSLETAVTAGDTAEASALADGLGAHGAAAASLTSDPLWSVAELIPSLGPNLAAVRIVSQAASTLASGAVDSLVTVAETVTIDDLKPIKGRIPTEALQSASPSLTAATTAARQASTDVLNIDQSQLLPPLASAVGSAAEVLGRVSTRVSVLSNIASLLPAMLGAAGARDYVVVVQNNAEVRATGGIPGALALLHTDHGALTLTKVASTSDFPLLSTPVTELPQGTVNVFGMNPAKTLQDTTMTPDFSVTARSVSAMWAQEFGVTPDGVLSLDPVTLSYLLKATGPVTLATGDVLTEKNATTVLLSEVYEKYPIARDQDVFFSATAATIFDKISTGNVNSSALIDALTRAGRENRVFVWNSREAEQNLLDATTLAGIVPAPTLGAFGVYLNDQTAAKMDVYLDSQISTGVVGCRADKRRTYVVRVTLANRAPADAGSTLPHYVTGEGAYGTPMGNIRTSIVVYGPPSAVGTWGGVLSGAEKQDSFMATDGEHSVVQAVVELAPGETRELTFRLLGKDETSVPISVIATPLLTSDLPNQLEFSCDVALK